MNAFSKRQTVPQCTLEDFENTFADRHLLQGALAKWAALKPDAVALLNASAVHAVTWSAFQASSTALAAKLVSMGLRKGDFLATSLPLLTDHVFLEYACFLVGVIHAPLDVRLRAPEVIRCLNLIAPKAYAFLGPTPTVDFRELAKVVRDNCPSIEHFIQFSRPEEIMDGAVPFAQLASDAVRDSEDAESLTAYKEAASLVKPDDGAQVIFTTGSTGLPKPALLSHRNIACQNMCLGVAFGFDEETRLLVNLPPSHVGGQAEALMTTLFWGGTAVILPVFDPAASLHAIEEHEVTMLGQIPAMFNLEWRHSAYEDTDLSTLRTVIYGGQEISRQFAEKMAQMAPRFGTGLGLTESAGFCTYTPLDGTLDEMLAGIGFDMPVYPVSIREPMKDDGAAGEALPDGEIGLICFRGPQTFLRYVNDPVATSQTISSDGYLYTGDMGFKDGSGLHFAGRAKWIIKPAGYTVFPGQVESHVCELYDKVAGCGVVGMPHAVFSEGIVAFVEKKPDVELTVADLKQHDRALPSYMRPLHYVILEPGQMPLNRVIKTDYVRLSEMARAEVEELKTKRRWDR